MDKEGFLYTTDVGSHTVAKWKINGDGKTFLFSVCAFSFFFFVVVDENGFTASKRCEYYNVMEKQRNLTN